jgi:hypothetical protein
VPHLRISVVDCQPLDLLEDGGIALAQLLELKQRGSPISNDGTAKPLQDLGQGFARVLRHLSSVLCE